MESEDSCSQEPATGLYTEVVKSGLYPETLFLSGPF
jgi:hypothetical protein